MTEAGRVFESQRRAAAPDGSVWVEASAGAGKTRVLVDRVLRLMLSGTPPQRILCLTFTRAAAAQMLNRINRILSEWAAAEGPGLARRIEDRLGVAADEEVCVRARTLFAAALDTPGGMKIQTIHAFCESVLGRFPLEAGIAPHFDVMDERTAAEALHAARDELLSRARHGGDETLAEALAEVTSWINEDDFASLMRDLAQERGKLRRLIGADGDAGRAETAVRNLLGLAAGETEAVVVAKACRDGGFDGPALGAAAEALRAGSDAEAKRGEKIAAWLSSGEAARAETFDDYAGILLTFDQKIQEWKVRSRLVTKRTAEAVPGAPEAVEREAHRLIAVFERRNACTNARASTALIRLAGGLLGFYEAYKSAHALLDYDDLVLKTRRLLEGDGAVPWVQFKLDGGIDHILIDEAQDTNPDQWAVVRALAEEFFAGDGADRAARTLFAVGDTKQSIFSFQRADPEALARMKAHFEYRITESGQRWDVVDLDVSFRSAKPVLAAVDAVFAAADARDGLGEDAVRHVAHRTGQAGVVELWPAVAPEERADPAPWTLPTTLTGLDPPETRLAHVIAGRIQGWMENGEMLESRGRRVRPGDVMVLVRRRTGFVDALVRALKGCGVPVAGVDRMVLTDQLAIMDLIALGHFLLLPEDDLTLATVLKGPLIGIGEETLFTVAHGRDDETLWSALRRHAADDEDCAAAVAYLSQLLARTDYIAPYELYAGVLSRPDGRQEIVARLGVEANDPIDEFLGLALAYERTHPPSLQGFLHWLVEGEAEIKRDLEQSGRDEVRIMTVHGAKGLEAPIVILADTMQTPRRGVRLLWGGDDDDPVVLWPPRRAMDDAIAAELRRAANARRDREYRRLLYVAMTRAEERLFVCGFETRNKTPDDCWYRLVERGLAGIAKSDAGEFSAPGITGWDGPVLSLAESQSAEPDRIEADVTAVSVEPLPGWAHAPAPDEPAMPRAIAPSRPAGDEPAPSSPLEPGLQRGILVHRLLQSLPDIEPGRRAEAARRFLDRPVHGLTPEQREALTGETLAVLDAPGFAALFGPGSRAEVPIIGRIGETVIRGRVDRLVVDGDSVLIVDYKTNRPPPAREQEISPAHLRQLAGYRAVLQSIYPDFSIVCSLLWTDGPVLMAVGDGMLAAHAP